MESIALIGPATRRLVTVQQPDTPTAAELSAGAEAASHRTRSALTAPYVRA